jgi:hypothetical protein
MSRVWHNSLSTSHSSEASPIKAPWFTLGAFFFCVAAVADAKKQQPKKIRPPSRSIASRVAQPVLGFAVSERDRTYDISLSDPYEAACLPPAASFYRQDARANAGSPCIASLGGEGTVGNRGVQQIVVQLLHQLAFRADAVKHLKQQRALAIAPAESKDGLRSRTASPGYGSARPAHRAQGSGSSSADDSPEPAPRARCTVRE